MTTERVCPRCLRAETICMTATTACAHCGHPWHPVCLCDVRGPEYDDVTFDPECPFHGEAA